MIVVLFKSYTVLDARNFLMVRQMVLINPDSTAGHFYIMPMAIHKDSNTGCPTALVTNTSESIFFYIDLHLQYVKKKGAEEENFALVIYTPMTSY